MTALLLIWAIAALCGLAAAAAWDPLLALALDLAHAFDPGLAIFLNDVAAIGAGAGTAIGWIVALAIGVPLTLLWLGFRIVARALRGPARRDERVPYGAPTRRTAEREPTTVRREAPRDAVAREPERTTRPKAAPPPPPPPPREVPRWGRQ